MSDVAVTWAKAQECVDANGRRDRNAKDVLKTLAAWADASGEVWASVPVLAMECDASERTIQRGLRALKAMRLLRDTGNQKLYLGRLYPIYQMPLEEGHASTVRRLKAEREAKAWGDTGVTPRSGLGVTPVSPQDVTDVTPRGDTGVTQIGKEITQGLKPTSSVCTRKAACEAWASKAPERVAPRPVERAWLSAIERSGLREDRLLAAVLAAVARDPDFSRDRAMNLDRWLDEDRYEPWLPMEAEEPQQIATGVWAGPAQVAVMVASAMGPDAVTSYLGKASWDAERRMVRVASSTARDRLLERVGRGFKAAEIGVEWVAGGAAQHG